MSEPDKQSSSSVVEGRKPQLVHTARQMFEMRWAKYNDPLNDEWDFDDITDKWERHAWSAYLDLVATEAERDALCERVEKLEKWQSDVQEREAAVCPEDVPFDEYIHVLEKKLSESSAPPDRVEKMEKALAAYIKFSDEAALMLDQDRDAKCLKLLLAMAGRAPKYRSDVDEARSALSDQE